MPEAPPPQTRSRWTLRAKWTLAILGVGIVPMAVLGLVVLDIQRQGLSRAEKELEAAVVDEAATNVMGSLDQASDVASQTKKIFGDQSIDIDARSRLIGDIVGRSPAIGGVAFFNEERQFIDAVVPKGVGAREGSSPDRIESEEEPGLRNPPRGEGPNARGFRVVTVAAASGKTGGKSSRSLRYEDVLEGSIRGFIVVVIARDALDARIRDLSQSRFGATDRIYLVDEELHILAGRAATLDGDDRDQDRGQQRPALPIFEASGWSGKSFATPLVLTTEFRDRGAGGTGTAIEKVGTIRTMPTQRWALVVERPTSEAFEALTSARRAFLLSLAVFAALAAIAGLIVVRRVLGPITALMRLVQRYGRREFIARSDVTSGDELEALGASLEHMADDLSASEDEIKKRTRRETNLRRYMPAEAADAALENDGDGEGTGTGTAGSLNLGGAKKRVTVVFADVVAFTGFAENVAPERAVAFLNELFTILSEIVFRHGGMVDKFIGDCIMAVFRPSAEGSGGDDDDSNKPDDVARALAAAEDMHAFVASNLPRWREAYAFTVELGIGVSTGDVLMGNLGSSTRMEYTVIGDAVNVASRLEALARPRQTLATQEVVAACPEIAFTSLGAHALRGKAKPIEVFEVVT